MLIDFACREGITHVVFGQSARSRWDIFLHGSVINRFLHDVRNASVHVVPLGSFNRSGGAAYCLTLALNNVYKGRADRGEKLAA